MVSSNLTLCKLHCFIFKEIVGTINSNDSITSHANNTLSVRQISRVIGSAGARVGGFPQYDCEARV